MVQMVRAVDSISHALPRVNPQIRYWSQDIMVNSTASSNLNQSYRDVNQPIHVEPAAKLFLSPAALQVLQQLRDWDAHR
jgi:hypothetical protein